MTKAEALALKPGDLVRVKKNRHELAGLIGEITSIGICDRWGYNPEYVTVKQAGIESDWEMLISTRTLEKKNRKGEFKMKVYVMTEAKPLHPEVYTGVKGSLKEAEKALRTVSPHMRKLEDVAYRKNVRTYAADKSCSLLYFIHEEEI